MCIEMCRGERLERGNALCGPNTTPYVGEGVGAEVFHIVIWLLLVPYMCAESYPDADV